MKVDASGELGLWAIVAIVCAVVAVVATDHALAHHAPDGVAVHESYGGADDRRHERFLYAKGNGPEVEVNGDVTLADFETGVFESTSTTAIGDVSLVNFATAQATVKGDLSNPQKMSFEASGVVSAYRMSYSNEFELLGLTIEVSGNLYYGGVGGGASLNLENKKFKFTPPFLGVGGDFEIGFK